MMLSRFLIRLKANKRGLKSFEDCLRSLVAVFLKA